jgi:hypothetical protein
LALQAGLPAAINDDVQRRQQSSPTIACAVTKAVEKACVGTVAGMLIYFFSSIFYLIFMPLFLS